MKKIFLLFTIIFMSLYLFTLKKAPLDMILYKKIIAFVFIILILVGLFSNVRLKISEPFLPQTSYLSLPTKDFKSALKEVKKEATKWSYTEIKGIHYPHPFMKVPRGLAEKKVLHVSWIDSKDVHKYCDASNVGGKEEKTKKEEDEEEEEEEEEKSSEGFTGKRVYKKIQKQLKKQIIKPAKGFIKKILNI